MILQRLTVLLAATFILNYWGQHARAAEDAKLCYAIVDSPDYLEGQGIYAFDFDGATMTNFRKAFPIMADRTSGACMVGDLFYYFDYTQNSRGHTANGFYSYDTETGETRQIANFGNRQGGEIVSHLAYDYTTRTMYGLWGPESGLSLGKVDLETGALTRLNTFQFEEWPSIADSLNESGNRVYAESVKNMIVTIAVNYDGDMFGLEFCGGLYRINKETGQCFYIGRLDYLMENDFRYNNNTLFFDNDTGRLYLRGYSQNRQTGEGRMYLHEIDPKTAHVTPLQQWTVNNQDFAWRHLVDGVYVPFLIAEASAPAKVQNVQIEPGEQGALTATLEWDNPSKTYARGGTLEDLSAVVVYRGDVEVWRNDRPMIGGHESFTDQLPDRGFYTYRIYGINDMGKGDRYNYTLFIGEDDPKAVGDLKGVAEGDGARLTWTAPTRGKYDAWIDTATLRYDIVRQPGSVQVAVGVEGCTFLDDQLTEYDNYTYEVTSRTARYTGLTAATERFAAGPSFQVPVPFPLRDYDKFLLWRTIDANGNNYTWNMNTSWGDGVYCQYGRDNLAAADWLISPRIAFKKDQHYKLTFVAEPADKNIRETLSVGWGQSQEPARMDSLTQFQILNDGPLTLRVNLPVLADDQDRSIGFFYCSNIVNYMLFLRDVVIDEDHEGYIEGSVTDTDGRPLEGVMVRAANGRYQALTDADGHYRLNYLPAGRYAVQAMAVGYQNKSQTGVVVNELLTTRQDFALTPLPTFTVEGHVKDAECDVLAGADVVIAGYNSYTTQTDKEGNFTFPAVFKSNSYTLTVSMLGYKAHAEAMPVSDNVKLGTIVLDDDLAAPKGISITADEQSATVSWHAPIGTPRLYRIDDGGYTTSIGLQNATADHVFGVINRVSATVYSVQFLLTAPRGQEKDSVLLRLIDLDEEGMPNGRVLCESMVACNDNHWVSYALPSPVDAPNGYYTCLAYDGFLGIAIDGNGDEAVDYPFKEKTNCYGHYPSGEYYFLDTQTDELRHNLCLRTWADPYDDRTPGAAHVVQDRVRYNVYRMTTPDTANEAAWTLLAEGQRELSYTDNEWNLLPQGTYRYAVKAVYTGGKLSEAAITDSVGCHMTTTVRLNITTRTPDNESWGTRAMLNDGHGHNYVALVEEDDGVMVLENVWKGRYTLTISLDGFIGITEQVDLSTDDAYNFSYELEENRVQPFNLLVEDVDGTLMAEKRFVWNFPDAFSDDFEDHDDFAINSAGAIGWQYIDGDGAETGGFNGFEAWSCMNRPMAFCVFNASAIMSDDGQGTMADYIAVMRARSGQKQLTSWASYGVANDDWIITPRLYFQRPFKFRFWARSYDAWNYPELIEVRYSTTGTKKDDFTEVVMPKTEVKAGFGEIDYIPYDVTLPAEARYVAIHHMSDQYRVLSIDDISFGYEEALDAPATTHSRVVQRSTKFRSPALEGLYEVYLDGQKVADTDDTEYVFRHVTPGYHIAGVLASYTSGKTLMSTIEFESTAIDGIVQIDNSQPTAGVFYDLQGRRHRQMGKGVYIVDGKKRVNR